MTYRELVYMCLDEIKLSSDDSYITEDHILYLISKYRALLLRQKYEKTNMPVAESNYQLYKNQFEGNAIIPIMSIAKPRLFWADTNTGSIKYATFVSPHRFRFVGNNKHLSSIYYWTSSEWGEIKVKPLGMPEPFDIYAVFEDCIKVSEHDAFDSGTDILDEECPIEAELVAGVQEMVVKDALGIAYRPNDFINNGADDLSKLGMAAAANSKKKE